MNHKELIASELAKVIEGLDQETILNLLEQPKSSDLGDIAFPAFSLAKIERKAPQAIAADIAEKIDASHFEKVVATGPYVNFFLDKSQISDQVIKAVIQAGAAYGQQEEGQGANVTIDLSSPNIAKPFSVGHLRSTVIGDAISNIYKKMGYNTIKINHLGDWGKQFGLLMVAYKKWGSKEAVEANPIDELLKLYVRINAEIENDPALDEEGRLWFKKLEDGDPEATELWQWFRDESLVEFNRIYAVGQEQSNHFRQLKAVLKKMGFDWSDDMIHVDFGLVTKNRQKLSTRKGNIILLEPTLQEAISRAKAQIEEKNPELENKEEVAHAVGVGAVKFYDLKTDRRNGYDFDLEAMVSFEGETGPYVQYAYARIQSILRKANFTPSADATYSLNDPESWEIIKLLQDFSRVVKRAAENYDPSLIAKYAINLAQAFNKYYAHTRILDESPERDSRLALSYSTAVVLKEALRLLGVDAPEKM